MQAVRNGDCTAQETKAGGRANEDGDAMIVLNEYKHPDNICNTPSIATIELHYNRYGTGEYFTTSITHAGYHDDGFWEDGLLTKKELDEIFTILMRSRRRLMKKRENERRQKLKHENTDT